MTGMSGPACPAPAPIESRRPAGAVHDKIATDDHGTLWDKITEHLGPAQTLQNCDHGTHGDKIADALVDRVPNRVPSASRAILGHAASTRQ